MADVRARVRRRRVVRRSALTGAAGVLAVVAAISGTALVQRPSPSPSTAVVPPVVPATTSAAPTPTAPTGPASPDSSVGPTGPTGRPSATPTGRPAGATPRGNTPTGSAGDTADVSASSTYLTFGPDDGGPREGSMFVMVENAGPADVDSLSVLVTTPPTVELGGPGNGCRVSGSAGSFRCTAGPLAAGASVRLRFDFVVPPGPVASSPATVTVRGTGRDPDQSNNEVDYVIQD
ncbi:hypothetical protein Pen02_10940 [Plantactinospora endophytica]|uniref:DUF11 domain-containing protein n=1 Tax=Plantactinospora endophytica TaxID=673535 RepID=A0ABQ4DUM4_9ACTN|nr:hypothetical protein Pen02_10940 [Plantactinospora endophytica]